MATQTCYRHPDRETGVSCSSCGRPICPDCMTPSPVGMRCPECAGQSTRVVPAAAVRSVATDRPVVTYALIIICVVVWFAELATGHGASGGGQVYAQGALFGPSIEFNGEYWRLITGGFLHSNELPFGILHIGFNMYLLYLLGQLLEPSLGHVRFALVYFTCLLAGSFGALLLSPNSPTVGASGAVFGLMGVAAVEMYRRGINPFQTQIGGLIIINLLFTFIAPGGISIGGHLGGLIGGALAGLAIGLEDRVRSSVLATVAILLLAVVVTAGAIAVA